MKWKVRIYLKRKVLREAVICSSTIEGVAVEDLKKVEK